MKLLLLLLLIPFVGMGQSVPNGNITITTKYTQPTYDTVKVLMICSDTTKYEWVIRTDVAFWIRGYEVRLKKFGMEDAVYYTHRTYLDSEKKQLSKNIIVWQSKKL